MLRSCVRESSSQPHTPRIRRHSVSAQIPHSPREGPREHARPYARNAMVAAPYRRFAEGLRSASAASPTQTPAAGGYRDRPVGHALNIRKPPPREPHRARTLDRIPALLQDARRTGRGGRRRALGGLQLRPVPVVLVGYGTSLAGAAGTALGLAAVTGACGALLRRSERGAAHLLAEERAQHRRPRGGVGAQAHGGGRHPGGNTLVD